MTEVDLAEKELRSLITHLELAAKKLDKASVIIHKLNKFNKVALIEDIRQCCYELSEEIDRIDNMQYKELDISEYKTCCDNIKEGIRMIEKALAAEMLKELTIMESREMIKIWDDNPSI